MAFEIDTSDIDMLSDIFRRRSMWLVPGAMIAGQRRAERHVRRRKKRIQGHRRYKRHRIPVATANLVAHYVIHSMYYRLAWFWAKGVGKVPKVR